MTHTDRTPPLPEGQTDAGSAARMRRDIDEGRTGDKIAFPDHAAAPLGTDDEAAGTSPPAAAVEAAHRPQVTGTPQGPRLHDDPRQEAPPAKLLIPGIIAALVVIALVAWWMIGR